MGDLRGVLGVVVMLGIAALLSEDRRRFPMRLVVAGVALQFAIGLLLLKTPAVVDVFDWIARFVNEVILKADAGIEFVFGPELLAEDSPIGFVFAVRVLPVIIFFASLMAALYHIGLMQRVVAGLAWLFRKTLGVTGAEAMVMASNVFVGQTEAPLCVRPFLNKLTRAQFATLMVGGFATVAGSVLAVYVGTLAGGGDETGALRVEVIKHLLTASVMSAPAAFVIARVIVPEMESPIDEHVSTMEFGRESRNIFDAAARGASEGLSLCLNVGAMLIAFISLLALVNWPLQALGETAALAPLVDGLGMDSLSLQSVLGVLLSPLAWTMGIQWSECMFFGSLMGEKLFVTELYAYASLGEAAQRPEGEAVSARTVTIATYALCGFANFASIGIQIGGLTVLAPERRGVIVSLALRAMLGGALASWMTASIAGVLI